MAANKHRHALRHGGGYGPDWSNVVYADAPVNNSYLTTVKNGETGCGFEAYHVFVESGAGIFGLGPQLLDAKWTAGYWRAAGGGTYTDQTAKAQSTGGFALETTTDNDGHIVLCTERFSSIVYTIATAAVPGEGYVQAWTYWNGSAWSSLALLDSTASLFQAQGRHEVVFRLPTDAALWGSTGSYAVRYQATDAPTTAAVASRVYVGHPTRLMGAPNATSTTFVYGWNSDAGMPLTGAGEGLLLYTHIAAAGRTVSVLGANVGEAGQPGKMEGR